MKRVVRWIVRRMTDVAGRLVCSTYGDMASMHKGPCERCVGHAIVGANQIRDLP